MNTRSKKSWTSKFANPLTNKRLDSAALAWFKLLFGGVFLILGLAMLVQLWRVRNVFEIKARSAYLVMLNGISLLLGLGLLIYLAAFLLFERLTLDLRFLYLGFYLFLFTFSASWMSRIIRLGVAYCPRVKTRVPWLMSERLLICASLFVGVASLALPMHRMLSEPYDWVAFHERQRTELWVSQFILLVISVFMVPIVWRVDDVFMISRELIAVLILQFCNTIGNALISTSDLLELKRWINEENVPFIAVVVMMGLSVIEPLRRLAFNPMSNSNPALARAQQRRRNRGLRALSRKNSTGSTEPDNCTEDSMPESQGSAGSVSDMSMVTPRRRKLSYEILAANPILASAFRNFAFRALCQESALFLEEANKYRLGEYSAMFPWLSEAECNQPASFLAIVRRFIANGSPDEVNISHVDREAIMDLSRSNGAKFAILEPDQKRLVFGKVYVEIRYMLETNLLQRFSETEEFRDLERTVPAAPARRARRRAVVNVSSISKGDSDSGGGGDSSGGSGSTHGNTNCCAVSTPATTSMGINASLDNGNSVGYSSAAVADHLENGVVSVSSGDGGGNSADVSVATVEVLVEGESKITNIWDDFPSQDSNQPWISLGGSETGERGQGATRNDEGQEEEEMWGWGGEQVPVAAV